MDPDVVRENCQSAMCIAKEAMTLGPTASLVAPLVIGAMEGIAFVATQRLVDLAIRRTVTYLVDPFAYEENKDLLLAVSYGVTMVAFCALGFPLEGVVNLAIGVFALDLLLGFGKWALNDDARAHVDSVTTRVALNALAGMALSPFLVSGGWMPNMGALFDGAYLVVFGDYWNTEMQFFGIDPIEFPELKPYFLGLSALITMGTIWAAQLLIDERITFLGAIAYYVAARAMQKIGAWAFEWGIEKFRAPLLVRHNPMHIDIRGYGDDLLPPYDELPHDPRGPPPVYTQ